MSATLTLLAIGVLGLVNTYAGYRVFLFTLAVFGGLLGGALGLTLASFVFPGPPAVVVGIIFAVLAGWLAYKLYMAGVAVLGATLGVVAVIAFAPGVGAGLRLAMLVGAGIIGALLAVPLQRLVIAIGTSVQGSFAVALVGVTLYERGDVADYQYAWQSLLAGKQTLGEVLGHQAVIALWFVLALSGALFQITHDSDDDDSGKGNNGD